MIDRHKSRIHEFAANDIWKETSLLWCCDDLSESKRLILSIAIYYSTWSHPLRPIYCSGNDDWTAQCYWICVWCQICRSALNTILKNARRMLARRSGHMDVNETESTFVFRSAISQWRYSQIGSLLVMMSGGPGITGELGVLPILQTLYSTTTSDCAIIRTSLHHLHINDTAF